MSNIIKQIKIEYFRVPLEGNLVDASSWKTRFFLNL